MAKIVSFVVLVVILLIIGGLFLQVMAGFLLPLFMALLLVVMFGPLHRWFAVKCGKHDRIAAALTTASILALVLVPLLLLLTQAGFEAQKIYHVAMNSSEISGGAAADKSPKKSEEKAADKPTETAADKSTEKAADKDAQSATTDITALVARGAEELVKLSNSVGMPLDKADLESHFTKAAKQFLAPLALRTTQFLGQTLLGLLVMILGVYYFFADGPAMIQTLLRLSPVETGRTRELIEQFDSVTRAVVVATLSSAFIQGLLAGVGFYVAGVNSVFLLTALAMLLTLVPFVGAAIVWVPVCLWLYAVDGRPTAAILLAIYCVAVVSSVDNLIKPLVLHGRSNLHPLLALLSVLGGVEALGPIGILVGPMVVAFLQTLLNMVHSELKNITKSAAQPTGISPATG